MENSITAAINSIPSKDNDEECLMHSKDDNIEILIIDKLDEVIEKIIQSLLNRYQVVLQTSIRGSDFIFDCVHLLHYKCHKMNFKRGDHM